MQYLPGSIPVSIAGQYVLLAVTDTGHWDGPGNPGANFRTVFHHQGARQRNGAGTRHCLWVVKQSNGYIAVESEKGKGALFKIYLPRIEERVATRSESIQVPLTVRGSETILLVEDAEPLRMLAQLFLKENGYHVLTAADGAQAQQVAAQTHGPIHLLLTD